MTWKWSALLEECLSCEVPRQKEEPFEPLLPETVEEKQMARNAATPQKPAGWKTISCKDTTTGLGAGATR
ncbi:hypothetical protein NDU88_001715 [Pleurodeles waltl]|uniref:Uncharacterized protein n=1 Tax=Pleurodeles waltl TaxID=8319 RepID=A0AAV7LI82_PLEWA|nr:hypothetical protein NDU88_001715 [Pleurodeles waltl]